MKATDRWPCPKEMSHFLAAGVGHRPKVLPSGKGPLLSGYAFRRKPIVLFGKLKARNLRIYHVFFY
jgi:hypothetical protein